MLDTRGDLLSYFRSLVKPLEKKFTSGCSRIHISGAGASFDASVIGLEGFSRVLWGLVPYWIGSGDVTYLADEYRCGIAAGTDPSSPWYWGDCSDNDQRFVEMAPIAFGLLAVPHVLWSPLPVRVKDNLASWLSQINVHVLPSCNWIYFRILVNLALKKCGKPFSQKQLEQDIALVDSWYKGDGWYVDGQSGRIDYYVPFAMHFYGILVAFFTGIGIDSVKERARSFHSSFSLFFDERGAAVPYGRSLTYRFAQSCFFSAYALIEDDEEILSCLRRSLCLNIDYWRNSEMLDDGGIMSVGYWYPNLTMAENYNSPSSPYWCFKSFLCLMLPDEHVFWTARYGRAGGRREAVRCMTYPGFLITSDSWNVVLYPKGIRLKKDLGHFDAKYGKFAYSSAFAFSVPHSYNNIQDAAPDSMLAFEFPDGRIAIRKYSVSADMSDECITSVWVPDEGIEVVSEIHPFKNGHIRIHKIDSCRDMYVYDCGFSFPAGKFQKKISNASAIMCNDVFSMTVSSRCGNGEPFIINSSPNTNLLFKNTVIPSIRYKIGRNTCSVIETLFEYEFLGDAPFD